MAFLSKGCRITVGIHNILIIFTSYFNTKVMTIEDVKTLKAGDILKCMKNYLDCYFNGQTYYVTCVEDINELLMPGKPEMLYTLQHNGHIVHWHLKEYELVNFFERL